LIATAPALATSSLLARLRAPSINDGFAPRVTRRGVLARTIAAALAACSDGDADGASTSAPDTTPPTKPATTTVAPAVTSDPFRLGISSGDPLADSVILWTRLLATEPLGDDDVDTEWEVIAGTPGVSEVT
jgi:phosphodiesterase/alkaline phosphatase D-like protein